MPYIPYLPYIGNTPYPSYPYRPYILSYQTDHTQQTYIPYLPPIQYQPFMPYFPNMPYQTDHTHHTYPTYHTTTPPPHHREGDSAVPHTHHTTGGEGKISYGGSIWDPSHRGGQGLVQIYTSYSKSSYSHLWCSRPYRPSTRRAPSDASNRSERSGHLDGPDLAVDVLALHAASLSKAQL